MAALVAAPVAAVLVATVSAPVLLQRVPLYQYPVVAALVHAVMVV